MNVIDTALHGVMINEERAYSGSTRIRQFTHALEILFVAPLPNVAEQQPLLHSAGREEYESAIVDPFAPQRERRKPPRERREHNQPVSVDRRRPWSGELAASTATADPSFGAAPADFLAPPTERRKSPRERRKQNRPVTVDRRRPWSGVLAAATATNDPSLSQG